MKGYFIIISGILWGFVGVFATNLLELGLSVFQVGTIRFLFSAIILGISLLIFNKKLLKISKKNIIYIAIMGLCNYLTTIFYYYSIYYSGEGVACIFLYCTPIVVLVYNKIINKQKPSVVSVLSVILVVIACVVSGFNRGKFSVKGIFFGVLSAIVNATVTVFSSKAIKQENAISVSFYGFCFSFLFSCWAFPFTKINLNVLLNGVALSGIATVIPYTIYFICLNKVTCQKAVLLCSSEVVVANIAECIKTSSLPTISSVVSIIAIILAIGLQSNILVFGKAKKLS